MANNDLFIHLTEAYKMLSRRISHFAKPVRKIQRSKEPVEILNHIVRKCYNKKRGYFQTSAGHFSSIYIRDLSWSIKGLLNNGYKMEVVRTLHFILYNYRQAEKVTTTVTDRGNCFDFPAFAADSLPSLLRCLDELRDLYMVELYRDFIQEQLDLYFATVWSEEKNWFRAGSSHSSIRDHRLKDSSCYDICMVYMALDCAQNLGFQIKVGLKKEKVLKGFMELYSLPDGGFSEYPGGNLTGDSAVFPFWCKMVSGASEWQRSCEAMARLGLDSPAVLRYESYPAKTKLRLYNLVAPNYQGTTIWMHIALLYLQIQKEYDASQFEVKFKPILASIVDYRTVIEVFEDSARLPLTPYKSLLYLSDTDMLWAAIALDLLKSE